MLMTFEAFKQALVLLRGTENVRFQETGKHGWTSVEDILDGKPSGRPGPHWCDASPIPRTQKLLGTYDFISGRATFFVDVNPVHA